MSEHAKEPWSVTDNSWEISTIYDAESNNVCELEIDSEATEETQEHFEAIKEANARRIVACVNACAGIATEALESEGSAVMGWNRTASKLISMSKQRDELLAALDCLADLANGFSVSGVYFHEDKQNAVAIKQDFDAIDNAKGGA